ncbi:MAG: hypothetical protein COA33_007105 [Fluviicola sp.]|nr:hypothetical protein [Fluviicola sp.]
MVREKFIRLLNDTIDKNPKFSFADFTIEQKKTSKSRVQTIVRIQYNYNERYFLIINIPDERSSFKKNDYSDEKTLDYQIECEYSPGDIEINENIYVRGTEGILEHLSYWLEIVWDELMAIPVNREFKNLKSTIDDLIGQMNNVPNEDFSTEERKDFEGKLNDLEKKFKKNLELQELEKSELENKLDILHSEIDGLKQTLKVLNKKNWFRSFGGKILSWGAKPENQKMISDGAKIVKGFIGNGE